MSNNSTDRAEDLVKTPTLAEPGWAPLSEEPAEQIFRPISFTSNHVQ